MGEMAQVQNQVDTPSVSYKKMKEDGQWDLIDALLGNTKAMRDAETDWLPQEDAEDKDSYDVRVKRSFLYNMFKATIRNVTSKPFIKPVNVTTEGLSNNLQAIKADADNAGRNLTQFIKDVFKDALTYGLSHILVEKPKEMAKTAADDISGKTRPYLVHYTAKSLIGFRCSKNASGQKVLKQVRFKETRIEDSGGSYGDMEVSYIRVLDVEAHTWELHRKTKDDEEYLLHESGPYFPPNDEIPLVTMYTNQTGFMTAEPPFLTLAETNLNHWQVYSDYKNILRYLSSAILFASGWTTNELKTGVTTGPRALTGTTNNDGDLKYVEHSGNGLDSAEKHLDKLEMQMEVQAIQPLVRRSGTETATGKAIDEAKSQSEVQAWIGNGENAVEESYEYAAAWDKTALPGDFSADIHSDFVISIKAFEDVKTLLEARVNREIDRKTFLMEIQRRGILNDSWDVEEIIERIDQEQPVSSEGSGFNIDEE